MSYQSLCEQVMMTMLEQLVAQQELLDGGILVVVCSKKEGFLSIKKIIALKPM